MGNVFKLSENQGASLWTCALIFDLCGICVKLSVKASFVCKDKVQ